MLLCRSHEAFVMWFWEIILIVATFTLTVDAKPNPLLPRYTNSTTKSSGSTAFPSSPSGLTVELLPKSSSHPHILPAPSNVCCFVVQDFVTEEWWEIVKSSSVYKTVNLTKITAHVTSWPGTTTTSYEVNVQTTNTPFPFTIQVGYNPISLLDNGAPHPAEVTHSNAGSAITTAGITVQSPAAFYVYSTVKVITAAAVTDRNGNLACGTTLGSFPNMNQNAQAYFGNPAMARRETPVGTIGGGQPVTPVVIPLTTPFIYQPERGKTGATTSTKDCTRQPGTEDYGYVPQTLLDFLVGNAHYSSQYPGLASCLPGGPSIIPSMCSPSNASFLTFTTTFTSTPLALATLTTFTSSPVSTETSIIKSSKITSVFTSFITAISIIKGPTGSAVTTINSTLEFTSIVNNSTLVGTTTKFTVSTQTEALEHSSVVAISPVLTTQTQAFDESTILSVHYSNSPVAYTTNVPAGAPVIVTSTGVIPVPAPANAPGYKTPDGTDLTEIITTYATHPAVIAHETDQPPKDSAPSSDQNPLVPGLNIVVTSPTTVPLTAVQSGFPGQTTEVGGTSVIIMEPTTFFRHSGVPADPVPGASATIIEGTPFIVIPSSTNVPVVNAPSDLTGPTTIINNTPFLVISGPTTFLAPTQAPAATGFPGSTTVIGGTSFVIIPGSTAIPVASAPPGLTGSLTVINNTPFLVVPGPTNVPVVKPAGEAPNFGSTVIINGTPMLVIPGPTNVPLSQVPSGVVGATTTINGVPFLVIPGTTVIPMPSTGPGSPTVGTTTFINGTPFLVVPGPTQIPKSNAPAGLSDASTTIINGTPFLVIPSSTIVQIPTSPANIPGAIISTVNGLPVLIFPSATSIPLSLASGISGGITTTINGTPFLVIPQPTTIAEPGAQVTALPTRLTVINGITSLVIDGRKTIPVDPRFSVSGSTTVIDGTTMVIVGQATTVPFSNTAASLTTTSNTISSISETTSSQTPSRTSSSASTSSSNSTTSRSASLTSQSTSTSTPTTSPQHSNSRGLSTGAKVGIAFAAIVGALIIIGLAIYFLRRGQRYEPVQQTSG